MAPTPYDLNKARALLRDAGWVQTDAEGYLVKDGKRFRIEYIDHDPTMDRLVTVYQEALRKIGIQFDMENISWSTWFKRISDYDYDMTTAAFSVPVLVDPEDSFSSKEADEKSGNNITGFKNPEVDRMIAELKPIFDVNKRNEILRRMDRIIFNEYPYILMYSLDNMRILYWNKFGMPKNVVSRYSDFWAILAYWWYDPAKAKALADAMAQGQALPSMPANVYVNNHGL
jgi:microcin C transport system substrate-binding protein